MTNGARGKRLTRLVVENIAAFQISSSGTKPLSEILVSPVQLADQIFKLMPITSQELITPSNDAG